MIKKEFVPSFALAILLITAMFLSQSVFGASLLHTKKKAPAPEMQPNMLTPAQSALVDKAIFRENNVVVKVLRQRTPLVETYIQAMQPDSVLSQIPESDQHFLGRVEFSKIIDGSQYEVSRPVKGINLSSSLTGFFKLPGSFLPSITGQQNLSFQDNGFMQMLLIDSNDFDRDHYIFSFVRTEFLGKTPTAIFDVSPVDTSGKKGKGHFMGRIWIETHEGTIVRFNGEFTGSEHGVAEYYHFDSWRTNVQPGLWLPTTFYVEESDEKSNTRTLKFKAIGHIWGYPLKVTESESENTSLDVIGATDISNDAQDISPLGAQRAWQDQAEQNLIERLFQAGLIDSPSEFDKTLEALANNILAYNNITLARPIHCRILLTEPLESLAIGNTIVISKGLLDTTAILSQDGAQQAGNLNAILAFQLAHIILGHRTDTKYAFSDLLLFPSNMVFTHIPMNHTDADNEAAAKKALELLSAKELEDGQQYFGLYLQQLQQRIKTLKALNEPLMGDGLTRSDNDSVFWLEALMSKGPKLDIMNLQQQAAMPLSSFLRHDPWTDQVTVLHTSYEPLIIPADKMPFEVTPAYIKLSYYKPFVVADPATTTDSENTQTTSDRTDSYPSVTLPQDSQQGTNGTVPPQPSAATGPQVQSQEQMNHP